MKLNDCNVFEATKLILLAELLSPPSSENVQFPIAAHLQEKYLDIVTQFSSKLSENVCKQLQSVQFLKETVQDDIQMLLLCDADDEQGGGSSQGTTTANLEVLHKAKALAALSLLQVGSSSADGQTASGAGGAAGSVCGAKRLLQEYLAAAEVRVRDILDTQLSVDKKPLGSRTKTDDGILMIFRFVPVLLFAITIKCLFQTMQNAKEN